MHTPSQDDTLLASVGSFSHTMYNYGLIGDMASAALVGTDGSIDWCCFPRFDSPSVFAAILDQDVGRPLPHRPGGPGL